jgi:exoribonuclease R
MLATSNYIDFKILEPNTQSVLASWQGTAKANRALPEDKVTLQEDGSVNLVERAPKKALVGILHLTSKYMYGMTGHGTPMYLCEPLNKGYPSFRVACKERDRSHNLLVSFQFESWEAGSELPRGGLLKILGVAEDPAAEAEALAILSCPWTAPRPDSAPCFQASDRPILSKGTFNIDPAGCKDIDDVITIEPLEGDAVRLWITIADVSELIVPGSKEYQIAEKIGATSYQDGVAVRPMLHRDYSEKACSLIPGERRYGLALRIDWSPSKGFRRPPVFEKVMVINQISFTYENVGMADSYVLNALKGITSELAGRPVEDSHEWIEQLMIFYNREAALMLKQANIGLLRVHDEPFQEKRKELLSINPRLEYLAYSAARYAPVGTEALHWGLNIEMYCHASSPIRRFADLVNQQILKDLLDKRPSKFNQSYIEALAEWLNRRQKQIAAAERDFACLRAIQTAQTPCVEGLYLWNEKGKCHFWIEAWRIVVRVTLAEVLEPGKTYQIAYFCDRRKAKWKERMIYSLQRSAL